uniref:Uncharacterized protein n=1 Tax=viral metagenome TaxID=1070528 RepID=A0A6M3KG13_9ZZZZ
MLQGIKRFSNGFFKRSGTTISPKVSGDSLNIGSNRVVIGGGANDAGITFGSLGTATKGIDFTNSGLSASDHLCYFGTNNFIQIGDVAFPSATVYGTLTAYYFNVYGGDRTLTFSGTTAEDSDGGRRQRIIVSGKQSGGESSHLSILSWCHDGSGDDQKGRMETYINRGSDAFSPQIFDRKNSDGSYDWLPGTTGGLSNHISEATIDVTAAHTCTIQTNVPTGSKLLGVQLRVDAALAAGETWNAQYVTGSVQSIATAQAVAANTKVNKFFAANAATDITSDEVDITIQRSSNPGVDVFTAQGTIRAIVYYQALAAMANV